MNRENIALGELENRSKSLADDGKTPMFVAIDGKAAGIVAVADTVRKILPKRSKLCKVWALKL